jgi:hypothetical protein
LRPQVAGARPAVGVASDQGKAGMAVRYLAAAAVRHLENARRGGAEDAGDDLDGCWTAGTPRAVRGLTSSPAARVFRPPSSSNHTSSANERVSTSSREVNCTAGSESGLFDGRGSRGIARGDCGAIHATTFTGSQATFVSFQELVCLALHSTAWVEAKRKLPSGKRWIIQPAISCSYLG